MIRSIIFLCLSLLATSIHSIEVPDVDDVELAEYLSNEEAGVSGVRVVKRCGKRNVCVEGLHGFASGGLPDSRDGRPSEATQHDLCKCLRLKISKCPRKGRLIPSVW